MKEDTFFATNTQIGHSKVKKLCTEIGIFVNQSTHPKKSQPNISTYTYSLRDFFKGGQHH